MSDPFSSLMDTPIGPGTNWAFITPDDNNDLAVIPKAILVINGGDLKMVGMNAPAGSTGIVLSNVPAWSFLPLRPRRIFATGTLASQIVAIY